MTTKEQERRDKLRYVEALEKIAAELKHLNEALLQIGIMRTVEIKIPAPPTKRAKKKP